MKNTKGKWVEKKEGKKKGRKLSFQWEVLEEKGEGATGKSPRKE